MKRTLKNYITKSIKITIVNYMTLFKVISMNALDTYLNICLLKNR